MKAFLFFALVSFIISMELGDNDSTTLDTSINGLQSLHNDTKQVRGLVVVNINYITIIATLDSQISTYLAGNQLIEGNDFILEVYELNQPQAVNRQVSSFDLGYCEEILHKGFILDIVIAKFDISRPNSITPQIEYKLYANKGGTITPIASSLTQCQSYNVTYSIPITNQSLIPQYSTAKKYSTELNVDILNSHHSLYSDHCLPFAPDAIDIILSDRRLYYYKSPPLCEVDCNYQRIDYTNDRVICKCLIKTSLSTQLNPNVPQALIPSDGFYFQIISCTKILSHWRTFSKNTGMLVIIGIIIIQVITIYVFLCCGMPKLNQRLRESRVINQEPKEARKPFYNDKKEFVNYFGIKEHLSEKDKLSKVKTVFFDQEEFYNVFAPDKNNIDVSKDINNNTRLYCNKDESYFYRVPAQKDNHFYYARKPKEEIIDQKDAMITFKNKEDDLKKNNKELSKGQISIIGSERKLIQHNNMINPKPTKNKNINASSDFIPRNQDNKLNNAKANKELVIVDKLKEINDHKLNNIPQDKAAIGYKDCRYEYSIQNDKRNYCQFLWYTLTEREIFCSIFAQKSKYELKSIKLSLCLLNLALDIFFNCFYYFDALISAKYLNNGSLAIVSLIIKAIIASLSTGVINIIMRWLFMHVKFFEVLSYEYIPENKYRVYSLNFLQAIQKKIMTAFVIELLILTFCLYYTTLFCGVYPNTQASIFIGLGASLLFELAFIILMSIIVSCMRYCGVRCKRRLTYYSSLYIKNRM